MTTLRLDDKIFTAEYIETISELEEYIPELETKSFLDITKDIINPKKKTVHVQFTIQLVSGEKLTKRFGAGGLSEEVKSVANEKYQEISKDCGIAELIRIKEEKGEMIVAQEYDRAAKLRDDEKKAWDNVEGKNFYERIKKEVLTDIVMKNLRDIAEEKRTWLQEIVNSTKAPINI